jgi:hypothetical protein
VAVAAAVEADAVGASGGDGDERCAAEGGEGGVAVEAVGLSPAVVRSCPAVSGPTLQRSSRAGAAWVVRARSWVSASVISSVRCWQRRARRCNAVLVAWTESNSRPGRW